MGMMALISISLTMVGFGWGIALGLLAGYFMLIYFEPDAVKEPLVTRLSKLDFLALQDILPEIPLWVKNPDYEKVDWLNKFIQEIWPYVNKAACKIIREQAEPYISEYKPKYNLEAVDFDALTLGTLPPVFMGVKIYETKEKELIFEVAAKFAGNPNVKVAVKAYGLKAAAQLVDAQVFATARITLKPLVPVFPCFSQICVSLMEKPHVDFGLKVLNADLMAIPGLYRYVQELIKKKVASMYLWPNKLDVPLLTNVNFTKQAQGVLVVTVLRAKQLRNKDIVGKSDPYVRLRVADSDKRTKTIMNNLNPEWNETFSLIVDDPDTDVLDISVFDWDKVGMHDKLGVQAIPLKELTPDIEQTFTVTLLKNFDLNDPGNLKNRGQLTLMLQYKPFDGHEEEEEDVALPESLDHKDSSLGKPAVVSFDPSPVAIPPVAPPAGGGLLLVIIHEAEDLEGKYHTNPYVKVIFRGEKRRSNVIKRNRDPRWEAEFEYILDDAPLKDRLLLEIRSKNHSLLHHRESLGRLEIDLSDVVMNKRINEKYQLLDSKNGRLHVELQWRTTGALSGKKNAVVSQGTVDPGPVASPHWKDGPGASPQWKESPGAILRR